MTDQPTEPIRKSLLPSTPPPEWEFSSAFPTGPEGEPGILLLPTDEGRVVVRRRVTYGDWEPVRPDRWADEPPRQNDAGLPQPSVTPVSAARDRLRSMALSLATGTGEIVDPRAFAAAIDAYGDAIRAELQPELSALAEVRRLCEMTVEGSMRVDAIHQAHDTMAILDRHEASRDAVDDAPREQPDKPRHPDGEVYSYAELEAGNWGFCDGCRMWSNGTIERPHQCPMTHAGGPVEGEA